MHRPHRMRVIAAAAVVPLLALAGCGAGGGTGGKTYVIKYSTQWSKDFPIVKADQYFVDEVQKQSHGRLKVKLYPNGVLGGAEGTVNGVRNGSIQMGAVASTWIAQGVPQVAALSLPFLFSSSDQMSTVLSSSPLGKQLAEQTQKKLGIDVLGWYTIGLGSVFTTNKSVVDPQDLQGVKMRTGNNPIEINTLKSWGAVPVPLANTETYSGLQSGTVRGLVLSPLNVTSDKYDEVLKHVLIVDSEAFPAVMLINSTFMQSLPSDLRAIITKVAKTAAAREIAEWNTQEKAAIATMKAHGVQVTEATPDQVAAFKQAAKPAYDVVAGQLGADYLSQLQAAATK